MIKELFYKIFRLEPPRCLVCDALREALAGSERERRELLQRVLAPSTPTESVVEEKELKSIQPAFVPWRVKQQLLEQEDRVKAKLMHDKTQEIDELEKELGVSS